jgi:hypothetical protein
MKDQTNFGFESGQTHLLGVHRLPGPEGRFELFLLTITISPVKTP